MDDNVIERLIVKPTHKCTKDGCTGIGDLHSKKRTNFWDIGEGPKSPRSILSVVYGIYHCSKCGVFFTQPIFEGVNDKGYSRFTKRVHDRAVNLVGEGVSVRHAMITMYNRYGVKIPHSTLHEWMHDSDVKRGEST